MPKCPWDTYTPSVLQFCEEPICAWVTEPANTWSNIGFFLVGLWIIMACRHRRWPDAWLLGPIAILTGLGSMALHGTSTQIGLMIDLAAMSVQGAFVVALNLRRWLRLSTPAVNAVLLALVAISVASVILLESAESPTFIALMVVFWLIEARLFFRDGATNYRPLVAVVALFGVSYAIWWLDRLGVICDPTNHLVTGHAVWHLLGAASFLFWYRFLAQFDAARREARA